MRPAMRYVPRVILVALLSAASLSAGRSESKLAEAIQAGDRNEVRKLLKDPAEVKATEADGTTPLHWAVRSDDLETSKALLSAGANANAANRYGVTPLSLAAVNGNVAMIEALLSAGASANTRSVRVSSVLSAVKFAADTRFTMSALCRAGSAPMCFSA